MWLSRVLCFLPIASLLAVSFVCPQLPTEATLLYEWIVTRCCTVFVLEWYEGYTVKYSPTSEGGPEGEAWGLYLTLYPMSSPNMGSKSFLRIIMLIFCIDSYLVYSLGKCTVKYMPRLKVIRWSWISILHIYEWYTVSVLGRGEGYTVKYTPLSEGVHKGKAQGNSWRQMGIFDRISQVES